MSDDVIFSVLAQLEAAAPSSKASELYRLACSVVETVRGSSGGEAPESGGGDAPFPAVPVCPTDPGESARAGFRPSVPYGLNGLVRPVNGLVRNNVRVSEPGGIKVEAAPWHRADGSIDHEAKRAFFSRAYGLEGPVLDLAAPNPAAPEVEKSPTGRMSVASPQLQPRAWTDEGVAPEAALVSAEKQEEDTATPKLDALMREAEFEWAAAEEDRAPVDAAAPSGEDEEAGLIAAGQLREAAAPKPTRSRLPRQILPGKVRAGSDRELADHLLHEPGLWHEIDVSGLAQGQVHWLTVKLRGSARAFRPAGSFESKLREGRLVARARRRPGSSRELSEDFAEVPYLVITQPDTRDLAATGGEIAEFLRGLNGAWGELACPDGSKTTVANVVQRIRDGRSPEFLPVGTFLAVQRSGRAFARYAGETVASS